MTADLRVPALVFGEVADDFDRVRLSYPAELVDDVLEYGDPPKRALEIGAGTGKATLPFAERGVPVVAVEPDHAMANVLARNKAGLDVEIARTTYEDYRPDDRFGLLYSADAWHWTRPDTQWSLAADALAAGGTLALFWNNDRIDDPIIRAEMLDVMGRFAPTVCVKDDPPLVTEMWHHWPGDALLSHPDFETYAARVYPYRKTVPGLDYLTHISTRSQIRMLPAPVRDRLLSELARVFLCDVPLEIDTMIYLARRTRF